MKLSTLYRAADRIATQAETARQAIEAGDYRLAMLAIHGISACAELLKDEAEADRAQTAAVARATASCGRAG